MVFFELWDWDRGADIWKQVSEPQRYGYKFSFHILTSCVIFGVLLKNKKKKNNLLCSSFPACRKELITFTFKVDIRIQKIYVRVNHVPGIKTDTEHVYFYNGHKLCF